MQQYYIIDSSSEVDFQLPADYLDFEVLWWFKSPGKTRIIVEHPVKYVTEIRRKIMKCAVSSIT